MAGEDFSFFGQSGIPACYVFLGIGDKVSVATDALCAVLILSRLWCGLGRAQAHLARKTPTNA